MTLREMLFREGVITDLSQKQVRCPFHDDHNPSATLFTNTLRCWSACGRTYGIQDFYAIYGMKAQGLVASPEAAPDPEEEIHGKTLMFIGPAD